MKKCCATTIVLLMASLFFAQSVDAASPTEVATAVQTAPHAVDLAKDVARVPFVAAEVLYVPLGASQIALSPLPGPSISSGLTQVGKGLLAPFKTAVVVLQLPFHALEKVGQIGQSPERARKVHRTTH